MAEERKQSDRRPLWHWWVAGILIIIVFFMARFLLRDRLPVREAQAIHQELVNTVSTNGRVEPENNYEFYSPVATTVKAVYAQPGDLVPAGKLLLVLDDVQARARLATAGSGVKAALAAVEAATHNGTQQERQTAAADIARDRLNRDQASRDLDALVKLKATGAASASEVETAQQRLDAAEAGLHASDQSATSRYSSAEVERAQAELADAEANLEAARQVMAQTSIHAPVAGTVYSLNAGRTDFTEEGKLLLQLADLHHERVRAYFDEPEIGRLAVDQPIQIKWDAKPGRLWHGHIVRTPVTVITYGTRNVGEVLIEIDDADGDLLPDTNVTVTVTTSSEPNTLSVPRDALRSENGKPYVYKVAGDRLVRTSVTVGTINLTQVAILSGLKEGDWVATGTANGQPLQEGIPIKVVR
ncbi:MAG: efflux RND transporter periplasmic adaptor subunit [Terracidiphilus sp.]|jgi:HlyD family secretion protein